ncbi:unnamed protein product [Sphenostylis stenocarpa]|uniref:Gnk2-homologous domain-containing protein n=1 Tax=Sphenostylis stenocarpa TaxID=92480 RepID=A0AA86SD42_9FABA|nr:unnamed protein product [Sphenostylis stenocarpa]
MASKKTLLLFTFLSLFAAIDSQNDPFFLYKDCSSDTTNPNTSFQSNLKILLSSLSSNFSGNTAYYSTKITGENPSDSIYGLFMCRGDVSSLFCHQCVLNATQLLSSDCSLSKQGVTWYEECMVWYSTSLIFSTVTTTPSNTMKNCGNVSNQESFMNLVFLTLNQTAHEAAQSTIGNRKFATREATNVSGYQNQTLYSTPIPKLVPETKTSHADSILSENPIYLSHNCTNQTSFTANNTFQTHLHTLFSNLASNATSGNMFYKTEVANTVFGVFLCRDREDLPSGLCGECVKSASHEISSKCHSSHEAIIWYSQCMLRYSYMNFSNKVEIGPMFSELNTTNEGKEQSFFTVKLAKTLDQVAIQTGDSGERYGTKTTKLNDLQTLYALAQCTQDLSIEDCKGCLGILIGTSIPWSRLGSTGGRVFYPSCNIRFELFQFFKAINETGTSSSGFLTFACEEKYFACVLTKGITTGVFMMDDSSFLG